VRYIARDEKRQEIPWVEVTDKKTGRVTVYESTEKPLTAQERATLVPRHMDCMDCHNRPSHTFAPTAEKAIDRGLAMGIIPRELPFIKREATAAIAAAYPTQKAASDAIAQKLGDFYQKNYAQLYGSQRAMVDRAISGAQLAYARNIFPEMNVGWGTYPNNLGHMDFPGCFRCHDDNHKTKDGKVIKQDCTLCHTIQ